MNKVFFLLSLLLILSINLQGQQLQGAHWFFGGEGSRNEPGTHLNFLSPNPSSNPFLYDYNRWNGVATISDKNGQLLFFSSNGHVSTRVKVNNRYQEMPNGNIFPNASRPTHSEMIVQDPGDPQAYYVIFITSYGLNWQFHNLYAAKVDMRLNNGLGDVVPNSLQLIKRLIAPGAAAMLHSNNRDTWLVTQNVFGDSLHSHLISPQGIAAAVPSLTQGVVRANGISQVQLKGAPGSELLVSNDHTLKKIKVYQFNRASGILTLQHVLDPLVNNYGGFCYAFSPDNSKLYVGTIVLLGSGSGLGTSLIYQYNLAAGSTQQVQQSGVVISVPTYPTNNGIIVDMQLGIDGKIYISRNDTILYLSRFNCPDLTGAASGFELRAVEIKGNQTSNLKLPSLNQTIFRNAGVLQANAQQDTICYGSSVQLLAYGAGTSRFRWEPANGLSSTSDTMANPVVNPTNTTTYTVTGSGTCQTTLTASVTVVVLPKPAITINGPVLVSPQMQGAWYKAQNFQKWPISWGVSGGIISANLNDSVLVQWGDTSTKAKVWATIKPPTGCPGSTDTLNVKVKTAPQPQFYNIITPNNDNLNDAFFIGNLVHYPENELQIFNRWGNQVYRSSNYRNNWKAEKLSSGVYYYYFRANGQSWKGWVEVMK